MVIKILDPGSRSTIRKNAGSGLFSSAFFFQKNFFTICILKNVPNFEVYAYSGNVVATETVVREPKNKINDLCNGKKVKLTKAPHESES